MSGTQSNSSLHRTELGLSGDRIVFLHGLFGQGKNWTTIGKALAERHRVLLLDLPDHGRSGWTSELSYRTMADAVAETLARIDSAERWSVVGHSMGGKVAMLLALVHPELVRRLCVVDMAPVSYPRLGVFEHYVRAMRTIDLDRLQNRTQADAALQREIPDPTIRGFLLQNLRRTAGPDGVHWHWQMNLDLLGDQLDVLAHWEDPQRPPYPGPVLWVAGAESDYIRPEYAAPMRALFPAVRTITVKRAGHWVHSEQPELFTEVLRRFVDG